MPALRMMIWKRKHSKREKNNRVIGSYFSSVFPNRMRNGNNKPTSNKVQNLNFPSSPNC